MTSPHYLIVAVQTAGLLHLVTAAANFFLPKMLDYKGNLARVSPIIRQIFLVHALFIVVILLGFATLCLGFPQELCGGSPLGKFLCGFLAFFWCLRVVLQFGYYDAAIKREHPLGNLFFSGVFFYLAAVFTWATFASDFGSR